MLQVQFDRLVHERIRLGILSGLAVSESLSFSELKHLLETSDGNLSVHARKLEDAGYIVCSKRFDGRLPRTEYQLTGKGVFVGLANYLYLLDYPRFWNSLFVTLKFLVVSLGLEFVLGLSIALLLNTQLKARRLFRAIAIMPLMLTPVVLGINFKMTVKNKVWKYEK